MSRYRDCLKICLMQVTVLVDVLFGMAFALTVYGLRKAQIKKSFQQTLAVDRIRGGCAARRGHHDC